MDLLDDEKKFHQQFKTEFGNIPCKIRQESEDVSEDISSSEIQKPLTFSF